MKTSRTMSRLSCSPTTASESSSSPSLYDVTPRKKRHHSTSGQSHHSREKGGKHKTNFNEKDDETRLERGSNNDHRQEYMEKQGKVGQRSVERHDRIERRDDESSQTSEELIREENVHHKDREQSKRASPHVETFPNDSISYSEVTTPTTTKSGHDTLSRKRKSSSPASIESLKSQYSRLQNMKQDLTQITETLSKSRAAFSINHSSQIEPIFGLELLPSTPKLDLTMSGTLGRDHLKKIDSRRLEASQRNLAATSNAFQDNYNEREIHVGMPISGGKKQQSIEIAEKRGSDNDEETYRRRSRRHTSQRQIDTEYSQNEVDTSDTSVDLKFDSIDSPKRASREGRSRRASSVDIRTKRSSQHYSLDNDLVFDDLDQQEISASRRRNSLHSLHSPHSRGRNVISPLSRTPKSRTMSPSKNMSSDELIKSPLEEEDALRSSTYFNVTRPDSTFYLSRKIQQLEESSNRYKKREETITDAYKNEVELSNQLQMQLDILEKDKLSLERALRMANESEKTLTNTLKITKENNENLLKVTSEYELQIQRQQKQITALEESSSQLKKYKTLYNSLLESHSDVKSQLAKQSEMYQDKILTLEKKVQESSKTIEEMDHSSSEKSKKFNSLHKKYLELESLLSQSDSKAKNLEQEIVHLNNLISKKEDHEKKIETQLQDFQVHSKALQLENDECKAEIQHLKKSLSKSNQTISAFEEKVQHLSSYESKCATLETQIQSLQQELTSQKLAVSESTKELQMAQKQIKVLNTVKSQLEKAIEHKVETYKKKETEIERQLEIMKSSLEKYESHEKDLERQIEELTIQNRKLSKEKHNTQLEARKQLSDKEKQLQANIEEFEMQFRHAKREWKAEFDTLKQQLEQSRETIEKKESEFKEATAERRKFQERYQVLLQEKQELNDRTTELESENYSLSMELKRTRNNLEEMKRSISHKSKEVHIFADDFDQVKNKYHLFLTKYDSLLKMHEESKNINRKLEATLKDCQHKMKRYREERNQLRQQVDMLAETDHLTPLERPSKKRRSKSILIAEPKSHTKSKRFPPKSESMPSASKSSRSTKVGEVVYGSDPEEEIPLPKSKVGSHSAKLVRRKSDTKPIVSSSSSKSNKKKNAKVIELKGNGLNTDFLDSSPASSRKPPPFSYHGDSDVSDQLLVEQMNECIHSIEDDIRGTYPSKNQEDSILHKDQVEALESLLDRNR